MQRRRTQIRNVSIVARQLEKLGVDIVFTGGAAVGFLLTDSAAPDVRPTDDVDVIVGIGKFSDYAALQDLLRKIGFRHDIHGPNCRFTLDGLKVDIMPSDGKILGFSNRWYDYALRTAVQHSLPDGSSIRVVSAPAFIATKLEAFQERGQSDFTSSHDLEDIIAVVDGRVELLDEFKRTEHEVRDYIRGSFANLLKTEGFLDSIGRHLLPDEPSQSRAKIIIDRMSAIAEA